MKPASIVSGKPDLSGNRFSTSTHNTGMNQRETIEETLCNLAAIWGADEIERITSGRGGVFYKVRAGGVTISYQSASNVILQISRYLLEQASTISGEPGGEKHRLARSGVAHPLK